MGCEHPDKQQTLVLFSGTFSAAGCARECSDSSNCNVCSFPTGALTDITKFPDLMLETKRSMPGTAGDMADPPVAVPFIVSSPSNPDMGVPSI
jgi:hypothetical protein